MSGDQDDKSKGSSLKRRILAALAAGPACIVAATVVSLPSDARARTNVDADKGQATPATSMPSDMPSKITQWWGKHWHGWRHRWGNWNNWHNWPNWHNWHNWMNW